MKEDIDLEQYMACDSTAVDVTPVSLPANALQVLCSPKQTFSLVFNSLKISYSFAFIHRVCPRV